MEPDEVPSLVVSDIHVTDVLAGPPGLLGITFYSVVAIDHAKGMVRVQDLGGTHHWRYASWFTQRWSLNDAGKFDLKWRVSPIAAVTHFGRS